MKKAELIAAVLAIISLGLNLLLIPGGGMMTVLTLSILAIIYMYLSFALFNNIRLSKIFDKNSYKDISILKIIGAVGTGLALSITLIGILFKFQSWPGASINMGVGLVGLLIVTVISLLKYFQNKSDYYTRIFKRVTIFGGIGLILMATPQHSWIAFKYRNFPAFVDAHKKASANPGNKKLWEKVEIERRKMHNK